jgi:SpoVK/Ycf46/Vps4 family AAA+-type ATPase
MENIQKLREVEKAIQEAIDVHQDNLKSIAEKTKIFDYKTSENMDEPFAFTFKGAECNKIHEDFLEIDTFDDTALVDEYDNDIDNICEILDIDEISQKNILKLKKIFVQVQASLIADIEESLADANMEKIEENLKKISEKIPGFDYDCWEETELLFSVDNINYRMSMWSGSLTNVKSGMDINEIEEEQKKE